MRKIASKLVSIDQISNVSKELKQQGKKIISTNGCFDILHWGHLQYLEKARELGDVLICAVNSDATVKKLKGPSRPVHSEIVRASQLAALESVDFVVVFNENTPEQVLSLIQPHIHVKGGDYLPESLPERNVVERFGGKVQCVELVPGFSTTSLITQLKS